MTPIPTLETERLRLVPPSAAHLPGEEIFWSSDRARFVGGPIPAHRAWRITATRMGHWMLRGYGDWALEEKATGAHVGYAGIWHPGEWPEAELSYHLFADGEGKGYATEAGRAVIAHAYGTLGWSTLISLIHPRNTQSQAVARRLGAVNTGATFRADPADAEVDIWRYPHPGEATA